MNDVPAMTGFDSISCCPSEEHMKLKGDRFEEGHRCGRARTADGTTEASCESDVTEPEDGGAPPQDHLSNCFRCLGRREPCILCFFQWHFIPHRTDFIGPLNRGQNWPQRQQRDPLASFRNHLLGDSLAAGIGASFGRSYPRILQSIVGGDIRN
jgi:hypothetical protein